MEPTPELSIDEVEFRTAFRGYACAEVDDYLERVAVGVTRLRTALADAEARAERAGREGPTDAEAGPTTVPGDVARTAHRTLLLAQRTADAAVDEATAEAERLRREAEAEVAELRATVERSSEAARTEAAQSTAEATAESDRVRSEAAQEAERLVAVAVEEADRLRREADEVRRREAEAGRRALQDEMEALDRRRAALAADVELLDAHFHDRRVELGRTLGELTRTLDDPDLLRIPMPQGLSGVTVLAGDVIDLTRGDVDADLPGDAPGPTEPLPAAEPGDHEPSDGDAVAAGPTAIVDDDPAAVRSLRVDGAPPTVRAGRRPDGSTS